MCRRKQGTSTRCLATSAATLLLVLSSALPAHAASIDVGIAFDGASIHNVVPWHTTPELVQSVPDSNGAVGPNHVVVMVMGRFAVHQKSDGALLQEKDLVVFWGDSGADIGPVEDYSVWHPRILYDAASQRWFAVSAGAPFVSTADAIPTNLLLAVSRTADPTQEWVGFEINTDPDNGGGNMNYPTLGVNADGVYVAGKCKPSRRRGIRCWALTSSSIEAAIEGVRGDRKKLVEESADLLYHLLALWASRNVKPAQVWAELVRREGVSGLVEKASRGKAMTRKKKV